jgi:hypothetical protein
MAEWLNAAVLKTVNGVTRSGVRIPLPPPSFQRFRSPKQILSMTWTGRQLASLLVAAAITASATAAQDLSLPLLIDLNRRAGEVAYAKRDWIAAQELLGSVIQLNPYDGRVAYMLGTALIIDKERDPEKLRAGTFYYARAAVLLREPSLINWVKRQHVSMFRTALGLDKYWDFVRVTPLAPKSVDEYPPTPPEPLD